MSSYKLFSTIAAIWRQPWTPARMGNAPYFWLLSFALFGWKYIYLSPSVRELVLLAISLLVFLPVYFYSFWANQSRLMACLIFTQMLGLSWAHWNFGASTFCIFAASMCSHFETPKRAYQVLAGLVVSTLAFSFLIPFESYFWIPAILFSMTTGVTSISANYSARQKESLIRKQEEVEHLATIAERERIARDMHDLLGHRLSVIGLKAQLAGKLLLRDHEACQQEIKQIEETARQALAEVREAIRGYRSIGLAHELNQIRQALAAADIQLNCELNYQQLPAKIENTLSLILREAATNILRHAAATECHISLQQTPELVQLVITDNGCADLSNLTQGSGLHGMRERVSALAGEFKLSSETGLRLDIRVPLSSS